MRLNPEVATIFDDLMTDFASIAAPAIVTAYDFSRWDSIMDVGGGNGVLLAAILQAYPDLTGVLADRPHVLERARERGFWPAGCRHAALCRIATSSVKYLRGVALTL